MSLVCALGAACTVDNANAPVTRGHAGGAGGGTAGTQQGVDGAAGSGITAASTGGSNNGGMNAGGASGALGTGGAAGTGEIEAGLAGASGAGPAVICDPATDPAQNDCDSAASLITKMVSDFEDGSGWSLFANPDDVSGMTTPSVGSNTGSTAIQCPSSGRCGTSHMGLHVTGSGFNTYGPVLTHDYAYSDGNGGTSGTVEDVSAYAGILLWARRGETANANATLRVILNDVTSSPGGQVCDAAAKAGQNVPAADGGTEVTTSDACWDGWMSETSVPTAWTLVKIPFSALKQGGWGKVGAKFMPDQLYGLTFQMPSHASFDFWIDDVAFYKN